MNSVKLPYKKRLITIAIVISLIISFHWLTLQIREATSQTTHEVKITGFAFVPQNLTINPGDAIMWNNTDPVIHTLWFVFIANGSTYLLSDPISPSTTWSYTFNDVVDLQYYSFDKLWITGFINVTAEVHDVAVKDVSPCKTIVGEGYCCKINVTVANEGNFTETFNVTLYADTTIIETKLVNNMPNGTLTILTFMWNTTNFARSNYAIKAIADKVSGEADTSDNTLQDGTVLVGVPCDVTGPTPGVPDGVCNMRDINYIASKFMTTPSSPDWDCNCDVTGPTSHVPDGIVNMRDVGEACSNFGKT